MTNRIVTKALAGLEDLLLGTGTEIQSRSGSDKPITKIDAAGLIYENAETLRTRFGKKVEVLTNVAALQALDSTNAAEKYVHLLGYTSAGDGGGGLFWLDTTDTTTVEDLNIVFNPDVLANGRWKRVDTNSYMSPDRGDADYTIDGFDFGIQQYGTALTANRTVTLPISGLYKGKRVSVIRTALGSFNLLIGTIATLTGKGLVELQHDGAAWVILTEPVSSTTDSDSFNGSFEIDSNNDNLPDNWTIAELPLATIAIDNTDSAHGLNGLKFLSGNNGGGTAISKRFNVLSGSLLPLNFTYKSSVATSLNKVDVKTYDKDGVLLSTLSAYSEGTANPTSYTTKSVTVLIDTAAVTAEIVLTGIDTTSTTKSAGTTTHFDNILFDSKSINVVPAFKAEVSSGLTLTTAKQLLNFSNEIYDTTDDYDASVGISRFQPSKPGLYAISAGYNINGVSGSGEIIINIAKNGTGGFIAQMSAYTTVTSGVHASALIYLNGTTDYINITAEKTGGLTIAITSTGVYTWFSGYKVSD